MRAGGRREWRLSHRPSSDSAPTIQTASATPLGSRTRRLQQGDSLQNAKPASRKALKLQHRRFG
jgi:hypothetical protein